MTFMHFDAHTASADALIVNLDGHSVSDSDPNFVRAGFRFGLGGFVYRLILGFTPAAIDTDTDWITPRITFSAGDYEVRFERISTIGNVPSIYSGSDTFNVFHSLSADREFQLEGSRFHESVSTCVADIRHASMSSLNIVPSLNDATLVMATAEYTINLTAN